MTKCTPSIGLLAASSKRPGTCKTANHLSIFPSPVRHLSPLLVAKQLEELYNLIVANDA